jgi:hypothetical protein
MVEPNCSPIVQADSCADLHLGNLAISIPGFENGTLDYFDDPGCTPVRNPSPNFYRSI